MIAKIWGEVAEKYPNYVVVRSGGIGYEILISNRTFEKLPPLGDNVELDIYTHVRDDAVNLVGFDSLKEKQIFLQLLNVSGVSIKIALSAFSVYENEYLRDVIIKKDVDLLKRVPGIGKKLAERIVLELSEKLGKGEETGGLVFEDKKITEVRQALKSLGYSNHEINKALGGLSKDVLGDKNVEEVLKLALKEV